MSQERRFEPVPARIYASLYQQLDRSFLEHRNLDAVVALNALFVSHELYAPEIASHYNQLANNLPDKPTFTPSERTHLASTNLGQLLAALDVPPPLVPLPPPAQAQGSPASVAVAGAARPPPADPFTDAGAMLGRPRPAPAPAPAAAAGGAGGATGTNNNSNPLLTWLLAQPYLTGADPDLVLTVLGDLRSVSPSCAYARDHPLPPTTHAVTWADVGGLGAVRGAVEETILWPLLHPEYFTGLAGAARGILLYGPPGTGKTMVGAAVAAEAGTTFINLSASSIVSKWMGQSERFVRAVYGVARALAPTVIFLDEGDAVLRARSSGDDEGMRRIKTELLVQIDGLDGKSAGAGAVVTLVATNRPQDIDDAARRRLAQRLYIPLPDTAARAEILSCMLRRQTNVLTPADVAAVAEATQWFSGSDLRGLAGEATMRCIREHMALGTGGGGPRAVSRKDFMEALKAVRPTADRDLIAEYEKFGKQF